jgi:dephospho-CoA kinase
VKRLAITGRCGSGKDYVLKILMAAFPTVAEISIARPIKELAKRMTPDGKLDRKRDIPLLQKLGSDEGYGWPANALQRAQAAYSEGMIPVFSDVRTPGDVKMVRRFGCPIIAVTCPREIRIRRILARDHISREDVEAYIDNQQTEGVIDDITVDHTFRNSGYLTSRELGRLFNFLDSVR